MTGFTRVHNPVLVSGSRRLCFSPSEHGQGTVLEQLCYDGVQGVGREKRVFGGRGREEGGERDIGVLCLRATMCEVKQRRTSCFIVTYIMFS